ncbi:dTDP-4-dehydrorhamnose 3,5-epimerase family protein [Phreatobacter stygius]|uniref:dTDP-4-dehydrorhamnose 3,5-epimerase n=1 Tax=Phreatobacter stygius TaxID=1940610 RepID=A0A4D7APR4_9HYPH|nr:dTDP-4-dehydrorhamnose 3,5-epimerase family protein [Phreatobacter stygius]QCI63194.1 hypothetical protein E8M01_02440 [Phreatobacter stygius]
MIIDAILTARSVLAEHLPVPDGVRIRSLRTHKDTRGDFTELFRDEWDLGPRPLQWNMTHSNANVLRGVHTHRWHTDYLAMAAGEMILGLHDIRPRSPTLGVSLLLRLQAEDLHVVAIPVGVAHGFYFAEPAITLYAVSHYFDGSDELGCRWNAPELDLPWPCDDPLLSERDTTAGSYSAMIADWQSGARA